MDTCLAIVRRKMAGKRLSEPDSDHLHHMLKRGLGVKGAVLTLYGIGISFGLLGIAMSLWKARVTYALAGVLVAYIAVISIKIARRKQIEEAALSRPYGRPGQAQARGSREGPAPSAPGDAGAPAPPPIAPDGITPAGEREETVTHA